MQRSILLLLVCLSSCLVLTAQHNAQGDLNKTDEIPMAPDKYRKPQDYDPQKYRYKYSLSDLQERYSLEHSQRAVLKYDSAQAVISRGKWKATAESIDSHKCPEWFLDLKFGMFIDWGLWSVAGWGIDPKDDNVPIYPDHYEEHMYWLPQTMAYHEKNWGKDFKRDDFIPLFSDRDYNPRELVDLAKESGMKYIIPFAKHHSGFCLWPSSFTNRTVSKMISPEKDFIKPVVDRCKELDLKFGYYFSIEDWEYPVIGEDGIISTRLFGGKVVPYDVELETKASGKIPVKDFTKEYLVPQAIEFIDKYDPDILWYDGDWETESQMLKTYDIAAYFYNQAEGRKEVAVNDRYGLENGAWLRSRRGDFFTSEYHDMKKENMQHAWEECRGISQSFGFNWRDTDANVITSKAFIDMFVDIVAKGGNLLLIVNLDADGALPDIQKRRLLDIGKWLKINGEGIYNTRPYSTTSENNIRYTRSKDSKKIYAISLDWPGNELILNSVKPLPESEIYMLGYDKPLKWNYQDGVTKVLIPQNLQDESNRPCSFAYTFCIDL